MFLTHLVRVFSGKLCLSPRFWVKVLFQGLLGGSVGRGSLGSRKVAHQRCHTHCICCMNLQSPSAQDGWNQVKPGQKLEDLNSGCGSAKYCPVLWAWGSSRNLLHCPDCGQQNPPASQGSYEVKRQWTWRSTVSSKALYTHSGIHDLQGSVPSKAGHSFNKWLWSICYLMHSCRHWGCHSEQAYATLPVWSSHL